MKTSYISTMRFPLSISKTKYRKQHAIIITEEKMAFLSFDVTAPFNNMRTLKFEAQPTNGFFAAVNQVFGGSS